jgi:hypothetical protein
VLRYQLGQDLVLGLHLLLQELNPFLFLLHLAGRTFCCLEGDRSVLEELLLLAVEHRRLQSQLFTKIGNRGFVQKMASQNDHLLFSCVVLALFSHTFAPEAGQVLRGTAATVLLTPLRLPNILELAHLHVADILILESSA